jgi:hypothetical protein
MQSHRRMTRTVIGATVGFVLAFAAPAMAATPTFTSTCQVPSMVTSSPFMSFKDTNGYVLAPGGSFEEGLGAWTITGSASIVEGNEPWLVGGPDHHRALTLAPGAAAQTASMCVDSTFPHFRFFARGDGRKGGELTVQVILLDVKGMAISKEKVQTDGKSVGAWRVVEPLVLYPMLKGAVAGPATRMALRFAAPADGGSWRIDDVYVDPWSRH